MNLKETLNPDCGIRVKKKIDYFLQLPSGMPRWHGQKKALSGFGTMKLKNTPLLWSSIQIVIAIALLVANFKYRVDIHAGGTDIKLYGIITIIQIAFVLYLIISDIRFYLQTVPVIIRDKARIITLWATLIAEVILMVYQLLMIYRIFTLDDYALSMDSFITLGILTVIQVVFAFFICNIDRGKKRIISISVDND